jgi:hypothetical protein
MRFWRAFIFSLSMALFAAISSPTCALENPLQSQHINADNFIDLHNQFGDAQSSKTTSHDALLTQALSFDCVLPEQKSKSNTLADNDDSNSSSKPSPTYQRRFNPNSSLPPFERQTASAFGSLVQIEPLFVLSHEFLPEILALRYFLAPLSTNNSVPWYLRPDAANSHGRLARWKDGNTLYTGTITYLS